MSRKARRDHYTEAAMPAEPEPLAVDPIFAIPDPEPAPDTEVIYFDEPASPTGDIELRWMTMEELTAAAEGVAPPRTTAPRTAAVSRDATRPPRSAPAAEPQVVTPPPATAPPAPPPPVAPTPAAPTPPAPGMADAASQIAELLQAAHESAARLQAKAKADVQASIDSALADIESRRSAQLRALEAARTSAEHRHAEIIHNAQLRATETRTEAAQEAARIRAAANAILAQAKAEVQAVQALARHNLAEIEAAKQATATQAAALIGRGRDMLMTIQDLDADVAARLVESRRTLALARQVAAEPR